MHVESSLKWNSFAKMGIFSLSCSFQSFLISTNCCGKCSSCLFCFISINFEIFYQRIFAASFHCDGDSFSIILSKHLKLYTIFSVFLLHFRIRQNSNKSFNFSIHLLKWFCQCISLKPNYGIQIRWKICRFLAKIHRLLFIAVELLNRMEQFSNT